MAARKKAAKKKAAKRPKKRPKKPVRRPRRPGLPAQKGWQPRETTIKLLPDGAGVDLEAPITSRGRRDIVRWVNQSNTTRTLRFKNSMWPFEGNLCDIVVPVGGQTGWYRIERRPEEQGVIRYEYMAVPAFDPGGPPGDPVVDAGD